MKKSVSPSVDPASQIAVMNRQAVLREIRNFQGRFRLDFTDKFLSSLSLRRLQHILLAAKLQQLHS